MSNDDEKENCNRKKKLSMATQLEAFSRSTSLKSQLANAMLSSSRALYDISPMSFATKNRNVAR
jgi:hypothetical protein